MRSSLALATVLALAWAMPASAQMCGAGQTTGPTTGATASAPASGGGCPMMRSAAMGSGQSAEGQRRPMCPMMAMMGGGGMGGMMGGGSGGGMGGMQMPSQPSTPATPPQNPGIGEPPQTPRPQ
jgi:hypothetical protein